jgi:hypothetical protein
MRHARHTLTTRVICLVAATCIMTACGDQTSNDASEPTSTTAVPDAGGTTSTTGTTTTTFSVFGQAEDYAESPISVPPSTDLRFLQAIFGPDDQGIGDRVVFQFEGEAPPGFSVQYQSAPIIDQATGADAVIVGDAILVARFQLADLEDVTNGESRQVFSGLRDRTVANSQLVRQIKIVSQSSRVVEIAIGLSKVEKYAVRTFRDPGTIVIEFPQDGGGGGATESNL